MFVWIFIQGLGTNPALGISICRFGVIPGELLQIITPGTRIPMGAGLACVINSSPNWFTVITSMFMHGGWFHLIGNMWFLFLFGDNVEDVLGPIKFILFYLLCGITAVAAQIIASPSSPVPMVGASGAISGVMGAYAVLFPKAPVHMIVFLGFFITRIIVPAIFMLGYWLFIQLIGVFLATGSGGVAFWAHIGGFISGILIIRILCNKDRLNRCRLRKGKTRRMVQRFR